MDSTNEQLGPGSAKTPTLIQRGTIHDEAVVVLREMIISGDLPPGQRIPEADLCHKLGISRTPLREAIRVLVSEGLVTLVPRRGALVAKPTSEEIQGLLYTLGAIESFCAPLMCKNVSDEDISNIEREHMTMLAHRAHGRNSDYYQANQAIHQSIVSGAGNKFMAELYRSLGLRVLRIRYFTALPASSWTRAIKEHEEILRLIKRRKGPELAAVMLKHMIGTWKDFEQTFTRTT
jgi:DNA-binding GntR family transcriptional regulator